MPQSHVVEQRAGPRAETWPTAGSLLLPRRGSITALATAPPRYFLFKCRWRETLSPCSPFHHESFPDFFFFCYSHSFFPLNFFFFLMEYYSWTPLCLQRKRQTMSRKSVLEFYFDSINRFTDVFLNITRNYGTNETLDKYWVLVP